MRGGADVETRGIDLTHFDPVIYSGNYHSIGDYLGAIGDFTVGVFKTQEKEYLANHFSGNFEVVSLHGTINTLNDEFYCHLHLSAGNEKGEVFGGHLNRAVVSATCEMVITIVGGMVDRYFDEQIGLNLFKFTTPE